MIRILIAPTQRDRIRVPVGLVILETEQVAKVINASPNIVYILMYFIYKRNQCTIHNIQIDVTYTLYVNIVL